MRRQRPGCLRGGPLALQEWLGGHGLQRLPPRSRRSWCLYEGFRCHCLQCLHTRALARHFACGRWGAARLALTRERRGNSLPRV